MTFKCFSWIFKNVFFFFCLDVFRSPLGGARNRKRQLFLFYLLIYCVLLKRLTLVCSRLVTSNPGKTKKSADVSVCVNESSRHSCTRSLLFTSCSLLVSPRRSELASFRGRTSSVKCCCLFELVLFCSSRLRCPVLTDYEMYKATLRKHQY